MRTKTQDTDTGSILTELAGSLRHPLSRQNTTNADLLQCHEKEREAGRERGREAESGDSSTGLGRKQIGEPHVQKIRC